MRYKLPQENIDNSINSCTKKWIKLDKLNNPKMAKTLVINTVCCSIFNLHQNLSKSDQNGEILVVELPFFH